MKLARLLRVQTEVELVLPAELETRLGERIVAYLCTRVSLGKIGRMGSNLVGDNAFAHIVLVRQTEMLLGRHVAQHRRAVPANLCRTNGRGDVVIAGGYIHGQRTERIERRLVTIIQFLFHVFLDHLHRHMTGTLDHHLHIMLPGNFRQLTEGLQLGELRGIIGIGNRPRAQPVAQRERHIIGFHDFANILEVRIEKTFFMVRQAPLRHDGAATGNDTGDTAGRHRHPGKPHTGMDGEVVNTLFCLFDQGVAKDLPAQVLGYAIDLLQCLVNRHGTHRHR